MIRIAGVRVIGADDKNGVGILFSMTWDSQR